MPKGRLQRTLWALSLALLSFEARAQDSTDAKRRAAGLFVQGVRQFSEANFEQAARTFLAADDLVPSSRALTNAISAARQANHHLLVARAAQRALGRPGIEPETAALAREALADAARSLSLIEVRCAPEPCSITLDGEWLSPGTQYTLPGTREFVALGPNGARKTERLSAIAGASYRVNLQLPEAPPARGVAPAAGAARKPDPATPPSDEARQTATKPLPPAVFWVGVAGTAVLAGLTTWSGLDALSLKREQPYRYPEAEIEEIDSRARRTNFFLAGTLVLGASTAAAGLWLVEWESGARAAVTALPEGGFTLTARGLF
jgi:hypothetical protein